MLNKLAIVALIAAGLLFVSSSQPRPPVVKASTPVVIDNRAELDALKADIERLTAELADAKHELALARREQEAPHLPPDVAPPDRQLAVAAPVLVSHGGNCASGSCSVGRQRRGWVQSNGKAQVTYEAPRRVRGGRDGRIITPFR